MHFLQNYVKILLKIKAVKRQEVLCYAYNPEYILENVTVLMFMHTVQFDWFNV